MIDKIKKPIKYNSFQFSKEFISKFNSSEHKNKIKNAYRIKVGKQYKFCFTYEDDTRAYEIDITKRTIEQLEKTILEFLEI